MEEWRPVLGHEGAYEVSDQGRVRSLDRADARGHSIRGTMLRPTPHPKTGHLHVSICAGGQRSTMWVHRLVLDAFEGPCPPGLEARHLDGVPSHNQRTNLQWGTRRENHLDRVRHGTHNEASKTTCPRNHRLTEPNLVAAARARGVRRCRACETARFRCRRRGVPFSSNIADEVYRLLMQ